MKYYQSIIIAFLLLFVIAGTASANSSTTLNASLKASLKADMKADFSRKASSTKATTTRATSTRATSTIERKENKMCKALVSRIDKRLSHFGSLFEKHRNNYEAHRTNLVAISAKLEAKGISTTKLKADIVILETKIAKLATDRAAVETALLKTKEYSCGNSDGQFRAAVEAARVAQKLVRTDAEDISLFIRTTLKQDVVDLRAALKVWKQTHRASSTEDSI